MGTNGVQPKPEIVVLLEAEISATMRFLLNVNDATGGGETMRRAIMDKLNDLARSVNRWHSKQPERIS